MPVCPISGKGRLALPVVGSCTAVLHVIQCGLRGRSNSATKIDPVLRLPRLGGAHADANAGSVVAKALDVSNTSALASTTLCWL